MSQSRLEFGITLSSDFKRIFVAGGRISLIKSTSKCEQYIVDRDIWENMPELNESKMNTSLCYFSCTEVLYCFGGWDVNERSELNSIERLLHKNKQWELLNLKLT